MPRPPRRPALFPALVAAALGTGALVAAGAPAAAAPPAAAHPSRPARPDSVRLVEAYAHRRYVAVDWRAPRAGTYRRTLVRYARGRIAPATPTSGTRVRLTSPTATSTRLTGLAPATTYAVAIWTRAGSRFSARVVTRFTTLATAAPPTGTISGTVTDDAGSRLAGVVVAATGTGTSRSSGATTGADGGYRLTVPTGTVDLEFAGADATGGDSDATGYLGSGVQVQVARGARLTESTALAPGGAITGTVVNPAGTGLSGVGVYARPPVPYVGFGGFAFTARFDRLPVTGPGGTFTLKGLPSTAAQVCFDAADRTGGGSGAAAGGYRDRCAPGAVTAAAGGIRVIDPVTLLPAANGSVTGRVTDSAGRPLGGVTVAATPRDAEVAGGGSARTDAAGHYRIAGLPAGRYDICADPSIDPGLADDAAPGTARPGPLAGALTCRFGAAAVRAGRSATVDVRLRRAGAAAGRLRVASGAPVAGAYVTVTASGGATGGSAVTDTGGRFEVPDLPAGRYTVCYDASAATVRGAPTGVASGCLRQGELVRVRAGVVRIGLDATLAAAGAVSGTVTGTAGEIAAVAAFRAGDTERPVGYAEADSAGRYVVTGLPAGRYSICAAIGGTSDDGLGSCAGGSRPSSATPVRVRAGRTTRGVGVALPSSGSITVTVTDGAGHPLAGVDVALLRACPADDFCDTLPLFDPGNGVAEPGSAMTDAAGRVTFDALRAPARTRYAVCAFAYYGSAAAGDPDTGYLDRCSSTRSFGLTVSAGSDRAVRLALSPASAVSGRVTDADGTPLAGVRVTVGGSSSTDYYDPQSYVDDFGAFGPGGELVTGADGSYLVRGVQPGKRPVCFDAAQARPVTGTAPPTGYVDGCVSGSVVSVPSAATLSGVDRRLAFGSGLAGRVVDATSRRPVAGADVLVFSPSGDFVAGAATDPAGRYELDRLPAGHYRVCFYAEGHRPQCDAGVPWSLGALPARAAVVTTAARSVVRLPDARLRRG
jgi:protocatechuate 3,4-dioxygenase beta subunit